MLFEELVAGADACDCGFTVSTRSATAFDSPELLSAASVAVAVYVCDPSVTPVSVLLHAPLPLATVLPRLVAPSRTATVAPLSAVPSRTIVEVLWRLPVAGLVIAGAAGLSVSITQVKLAGVDSVFPASSVARTSRVCEPSPSAASVSGELQALQPPPSSWHSNVRSPAAEW